MNRSIFVAAVTFLLLGLGALHAEPAPYEYKVATTEFALLAADESSKPLVIKWAKKHRPKLAEIAFGNVKPVAKKDEKPLDGLFSLGASLGAQNDLFLDYYLYQQGLEGWEPFKIEEKSLLLRRKRPSK